MITFGEFELNKKNSDVSIFQYNSTSYEMTRSKTYNLQKNELLLSNN
jgi:hypothetical protein